MEPRDFFALLAFFTCVSTLILIFPAISGWKMWMFFFKIGGDNYKATMKLFMAVRACSQTFSSEEFNSMVAALQKKVKFDATMHKISRRSAELESGVSEDED